MKENIPENVQNSNVAIAIKTATDNVVQAAGAQTIKFLGSIDNNYLSAALKMIDFIIAGLSLEHYNNAKAIIKMQH